MKNLITLVLTVLFSIVCFAQNGINYKAIIKDNSGNVIANSLVVVQFTILKGVAQTNVYQENHTPTTNANGLIIINIGEGTPVNGTFAAINWANGTSFLNTKINTGAGLVDMGTTEFKTVPYAKNAETATFAANVNGLEALNETNGIGWRLKGRNVNNYGNLGLNAVDFSSSYDASTTLGATGLNSTAIGSGTTASGNYATAMGRFTTASGYASKATGSSTEASGENSTATGEFTTASARASTAMGLSTIASEQSATAMGQTTVASGYFSTSMGQNTIAASSHSLSIGRFNVGGGFPTSWINTDPLFEIGNGTSLTSKSNALTILKNGTITAPSFDLAEITDPKALITKEYFEANSILPSGLEALDEGNGRGWGLIGRNPNNYGNIGFNAVDLSYSQSPTTIGGATGFNSTAMGRHTKAIGDYSTAMGQSTRASGENSTAMGYSSEASGVYSTAMGRSTTASGENSTAMGYQTEASGINSVAIGVTTLASGSNSTSMGQNTTASSSGSLAIGRYNVGGGNATTWVATDPLFEVGFGTSATNKLNALTVTKNGKVGIGTAAPSTFLQITNGYDASLSNGSGYFMIGLETGTNLVFDNNEIIARNNGATSPLFFQENGGDVRVGGVIVHSSDRRLKKDITSLSYGLETILKLNPVEYNWKNREQEFKSLGLIAQEAQPIIKNIVHTADDDDKTLSISYTELIPVIIKALQEQQDIINSQSSKINTLTAEVETKEEALKAIVLRVQQIESTLNILN